MNRTAVLIPAIALLFALAPQAEAQEVADYVISYDVTTDFYGDRFSHNGLRVATKRLRQLYEMRADKVKKAVWSVDGTVLSESLRLRRIRDEDQIVTELTGWMVSGEHTIVRRRARMDILFRGPAELPKVGVLADAIKVVPTTLATLFITARDRERDVRIGRRHEVKVTLDELHAIRTRPAAVKRTGFGALLRYAWAEALGDVKDDVKTIEASIRVRFGGVKLADGTTLSHFDQEIASDKVDLVLGRKVTGLEWMGNFLGRNDPLLDLDDDHANALKNALRRSRGDASARAQISHLRMQEVHSLMQIDRIFSPSFLSRLDGGRRGLSSLLPQ